MTPTTDELPRVPLPTVPGSCERFLAWCAPLLTPDELARTEAAVAELLAPGSPAPALQEALAAYAETPDVHSWLDDFWRLRYLGRRDRIALNANFCFLFHDTGQSQHERAATLVAGALDHRAAVDGGTYPDILERGQPLSMVQHRHLFGTTRVPGRLVDRVRTPYSEETPGPATARHILVLARGHLYRLDVVGPDGPYPAPTLAAALRDIDDAAAADRGQGLGSLTTLARADWAAVRDDLVDARPANAALLETIETALFAVALDPGTPVDQEAACRELLAGDSGSRWFDTALTFVVFADGRAGVNGEHCLLDGKTVAELYDDILDRPHPGGDAAGTPTWSELVADLAPELEATVAKAGEEFAAYSDAMATRLLVLPEGSRDRAKSLGMSPDAFVQLAFQLAHQRARGRVGATYESVSTRHFHHGRTEAMRVVTPEVVDFVSAMTTPGTSAEARAATARAAAEAHVRRARACQSGQAPEQHLWQLQLLHAQDPQGDGEPLALFESPGWLTMRDDDLSTSSVASPNLVTMAFGATSRHCIGVAYSPLPDRLTVHLSAPRAIADELEAYAAALPAALAELTAVLGGTDAATDGANEGANDAR